MRGRPGERHYLCACARLERDGLVDPCLILDKDERCARDVEGNERHLDILFGPRQTSNSEQWDSCNLGFKPGIREGVMDHPLVPNA